MTAEDAPCSQGELKNVRVLLEALRVEIAGMHRLMDERHALYAERDSARKEAVQAALVAQEKLVNAAFAASKEAILKAEESQKGVNERSNEFRAQLGDQANTLMPRAETEALLRDIRDRLEAGRTTAAFALEELKRESRSDNDKLRVEILALRESRAAMDASARQVEQARRSTQWAIGAVLTAGLALLGLIVSYAGLPTAKAMAPAGPPVIIVQPSPAAPTAGSVTDTKSTTRNAP